MPSKRKPNWRDAGWSAWAKMPQRRRTLFAATSLVVVLLGALGLAVLGSLRVGTTEAVASAQLYKNPNCSCCEGYASYLRAHGYAVTTTPTHDLSLIRRQHGVPDKLAGCHTTIVGGYVVEGHVPVGALNRLLAERPKIKGISLPGMPEGSPGMTGVKSQTFTIYEISGGNEKVFAVE